MMLVFDVLRGFFARFSTPLSPVDSVEDDIVGQIRAGNELEREPETRL